MSKKILITGLGYVGFEICKLYSQDKKYDITVIDKEIYPARIKWCSENNVTFIQKDLFELDKTFLQGFECIIHGAGITLVAQSAKDDTIEHTRENYRVGVGGTRHILDNINKDIRFLFLSTHIVEEGYNNVFDIDETLEPKPILSYGLSKRQSELDLFRLHNNFIITRLGSIYGYNGDGTRWRIVTNLFPLKAALGQKIKVFNGDTFKPICGIADCAAAIKFLAESNYKNEIFNLVSENTTINQIADLCKKYAPNAEIEKSLDTAENLGYSLSNEKIKKAGFVFTQGLEGELKRMIFVWKPKNKLDFV